MKEKIKNWYHGFRLNRRAKNILFAFKKYYYKKHGNICNPIQCAVAFTNLEKAFDRNNSEILWKTLGDRRYNKQ